MTPREFFYVTDWYYNDADLDRRENWDTTRILAYYVYCSIPKGKGKRNPTYKQFCAQHIPMPWDKVSKEEAEGAYEEDNAPTPEDWAKMIQNLSNPNVKKEELGAQGVKSI